MVSNLIILTQVSRACIRYTVYIQSKTAYKTNIESNLRKKNGFFPKKTDLCHAGVKIRLETLQPGNLNIAWDSQPQTMASIKLNTFLKSYQKKIL